VTQAVSPITGPVGRSALVRLQGRSDCVDPLKMTDHRQPHDRSLTMTQGLRSVLTSRPGIVLLLGVIVLLVAVVIVVVQDAFGGAWSTVIEIVAVIAGAAAIRFLARRHRSDQAHQM
jgi:hypothetical protein